MRKIIDWFWVLLSPTSPFPSFDTNNKFWWFWCVAISQRVLIYSFRSSNFLNYKIMSLRKTHVFIIKSLIHYNFDKKPWCIQTHYLFFCCFKLRDKTVQSNVNFQFFIWKLRTIVEINNVFVDTITQEFFKWRKIWKYFPLQK
jgi:hypothetical protein